MPQPQVIDFDALAAQHGGQPVIDYDALAAQHGGQSATQPQDSQLTQFIGHVREATNPINIVGGMIHLGSKILSPKEAGEMVLDSIEQPFREALKGEYGAAAGDLVGAALVGKALKWTPTAARAAAPAAVRATAALGDVVDPAIIGVASPRAGNIVRAAQRMRAAMPDAPAETPPIQAAIDDAVAKGVLRRDPNWTPGAPPIQRDAAGRPVKTPLTNRPALQIVQPATAPPDVTPLTGRPPVQVTEPAAPPAAESATPPRPEAPTRTPTKPAKPIAQGVALKQVIDEFTSQKVMPQAAEVANAAAFVQRGFTPTEAIAKVLAKRPATPPTPLSLSEQLAQKLGTPSDATVVQAVLDRNATGKWKP